MNEFMMIFRNEYNPDSKPSPEQIQASLQQWKKWIEGIAAQGKFVSTNRIGFQGKVVNVGNEITDGPYTVSNQMIGGYIIIKAENFDDAISLTEGCPILAIGGNVEIRDIIKL